MFKSTKQIFLMLPIRQLPGYYRDRYEDLSFKFLSLHSAPFPQNAHPSCLECILEKRWLLFWNPSLPETAAFLYAKHNTGDALNSSEISAVPHLQCE